MNYTEKILTNPKWVVLIITVSCLLIYGKTISYDYSLDDHLINTNLPDKENGLNGLVSVFKSRFGGSDYRPVLVLSYALEKYVLGELNPHVSHAVNLLLYTLLCISVYYFTLQLPIGKNKLMIAFIITLLFVTHPIHANVVGNLKSRDNLLSMLFGILTTIQILKIFTGNNSFPLIRMLFAVLFFAIAVLSKIDVLGFLFFIPLILILYYNIKLISTPVFIILIVLFITQTVFYNYLPDRIAPVDADLEARVTFTENPFSNDFTFTNRTGAAAMTGIYYVKLLLIPYGYWYYFGFDQVKLFPIISLPAFSAFLLLLIIFIIGIWHLKKDKLLSLGILSLFIFLIYCFNFLQPVAGIIADRYAFMASVGFCIIITALIIRFTGNQFNLLLKIGLLICIIWSVFSYNRVSVWKDAITLIRNDAPFLGRSYEGQRIAAMTYVDLFEKNHEYYLLDNALIHIKKANKIYPKNTVCHIFEGLVYYKKGLLNEANTCYETALNNDPTSTEALEIIGDLKYEQHNFTAARNAYEALRKLKPESDAVVNKISTLIYEAGDIDSVLSYNYALMKSDTALFAPYENLGYLYLLEKDTNNAKLYFEKAVKKGMNPLGIPLSLR